jgi:hypothetical protein
MLTTGKIISVNCNVTDYIDNNGAKFSEATYKNNLYKIIDRDYDGPIFGSKKYFGKR